jgi:hypothetical protein
VAAAVTLGSAFYFFRTHAAAEIDLLIHHGRQRSGFGFKAAVATDADDWKYLRAGIDDGVIHRGCVRPAVQPSVSPPQAATHLAFHRRPPNPSRPRDWVPA